MRYTEDSSAEKDDRTYLRKGFEMVICSYDPQKIAALFMPPNYDAHCQSYREAKWLRQSYADTEMRAEAVHNWAANLIADYMTARPCKVA